MSHTACTYVIHLSEFNVFQHIGHRIMYRYPVDRHGILSQYNLRTEHFQSTTRVFALQPPVDKDERMPAFYARDARFCFERESTRSLFQ